MPAQVPPTQKPVAQSASVAQLGRQPVFAWLQISELGQLAALPMHFWLPSQVLVVSVEPVQDALAHVAPAAGARHALAPSQVPSGPQGALLVDAQAP